MYDAQQALARLKEGNRRFVDGSVIHSFTGPERRRELEAGQAPFAIILGCADSRVPAEMVFDQGLGDLFVIRVAGNIVAPSQVGSVEFAAGRYGSRLVVVLGHSTCGAVMATVEELNSPDGSHSRNVRSIVGRILPTVADLLELNENLSPEETLARAIRANIRASVDHLRHGSEILETLIRTEGLMVVGAHYSLETGEVEFMDGLE